MEAFGLKKVTDALEQIEQVPHPLLFEIMELRAYAATKRAYEAAKTPEQMAAADDMPLSAEVADTIRWLRKSGRRGIRVS